MAKAMDKPLELLKFEFANLAGWYWYSPVAVAYPQRERMDHKILLHKDLYELNKGFLVRVLLEKQAQWPNFCDRHTLDKFSLIVKKYKQKTTKSIPRKRLCRWACFFNFFLLIISVNDTCDIHEQSQHENYCDQNYFTSIFNLLLRFTFRSFQLEPMTIGNLELNITKINFI